MINKHLLSFLFTISFAAGACAQQVLPVTSFGDSGTFKQVVQNSYAYANSAIIQPDGKLLVSVTSSDDFGYSTRQLIYRLTPAGAFDKSFGNNGIIQVGN